MANLKIESRTYRITGLTPILGSLPAIKDLRTRLITAKATDDGEAAKEETASTFDINERGLTVFARDKQGHLCVMGYQIKGFFKSALYALRGQYNIAAYKSKVDLLVFVEPRFVPIKREDAFVFYEDTILERPLRSNGPQGERVAIASSEQIDDPWSITIEISLLPNAVSKSAKGENLTWDIIEAALDYGAYHGLGQWRNADYGRFIWERIED